MTPRSSAAGVGPLVSARELLETSEAAILLDATVVLPPPEEDGPGAARSGAERFAQGHPAGAVHADLLGELADHTRLFRFAHPGGPELASRVAALGAGAGTLPVAYDDGGMMWAARLWWGLSAAGIDARVLDGGLEAWRGADGPTERGPSAPVAASEPVAARPRPERFADRERVLRVLAGDEEAQLVCTLSPDVFAGRGPSRYSRPGHIPGSSNAPAHDLLAEDGRLLDRARLREALAHLIDDPRPVLLYCGGGISASLVALGLTVAGRGDVAVYDGSLEEWSADPSLPLEVSS